MTEKHEATGADRDLLSRQSAIAHLGSNEAMFRALVAHTPVGVFVSSARGDCEYVNDRWCELAGLSAADALGDGWVRALHPDDLDRVSAEWAEAAGAGRESIIEYRFRRPDGGVSWIQGFASPVRDEHGEIVSWIGACLDLTARNQARLELEEAEERFRRAFDDAPIGMALVAPDGRWLRANRSLCELTGYSATELLQLTFQDITHPEDLDADLEQANRLLAGAIRSYQREKRYVRSDGEIVWVMLSVSLARSSHGEPLYFVSQVEDITERKQAQDELKLLAERDSLTGLLNRRRFHEDLARERARTSRRPELCSALLVLDIDRFKDVNDSRGHSAGDDVLRAVGRTLAQRLRATDVVARLGGDEFAALLVDVTSTDAAEQVAHDVADAIRAQTILTSGGAVAVTVSIGVAMLGAARHEEQALIAADRAMYRAKHAGRDRIALAA